MDLFKQIDLYCERLDAAFWAEPLNALSNGAFIVAAIALGIGMRRAGRPAAWDVAVCAALIALIGIGSFLFHTFATVWAAWLDVIFILVFIYVFLARFLYRIVGCGLIWTIGGVIAYALFDRTVNGLFEPGSLNGSYRYLPALAVLAVMALYAWRARPALAARLGGAVALLCVSLTLRTVDMQMCDALPWGTHFLWHALNALVLYLAAGVLLIDDSAARSVRD